MKLCIIVSNSLIKDPRVIKQIYCAMHSDIEVHFIGFKTKFYSKHFLDSVGCNYYIVDTYVGKSKSNFKKLLRQFHYYYFPIKYILKVKPDVIHANDFDTLIQSYIASKLLGCKLIYDTHEICAENIGIADKQFRKKIIIFIEKYIVKRIYAMISVSNSAAEYFHKKYNINKPVVITNVPYRNNINILTNTKAKSFEVLYQGLMIKGRGYEEFVQSGEFTDSNIQLILRGYGTIEEDLKIIILKKILSKKVRFDGPVEIKDIVEKASSSHLGVVLTQPINKNFKYTISNKIFEYIHAGLPVIMSNLPEHRFLNEQYDFGIILDDFSPKGIATAINNLSANQNEYNRLRENTIIASKILSWENESKKLLNLYKNTNQVKQNF
jgi:glycosyltransferase involved in cell wall biosynthesis